jgi:hypothetical protein
MRKKIIDKTRCKQSVRDPGSWPSYHQCYRKIWKDEFCKLHHPDTVEKREKEKEKRYKAKQKTETWYLLGEAYKKIKKLERENKKLKKRLELLSLSTQSKIN